MVQVPKTIDNDIAMTDASIGFATALDIATTAIDRLHSTAHSHHRVIVVEVMGHRSGWLALGAGLAGGADAILIPEIPYSEDKIAEAIARRVASGSNFSIVAVAEGARNVRTRKPCVTLKPAGRQHRTRTRRRRRSPARPPWIRPRPATRSGSRASSSG